MRWLALLMMGGVAWGQETAVERMIGIRDGQTAEVLSWDELVDRLATADAVFLGETHDDDVTHRVELAIYESLRARRNGRVVLAMEMFERDVQPVLDDYVAGRIAEPDFLRQSRPWGNYREAYRPLVESAKKAGAPVIASNFPRPVRAKMAASPDSVAQVLDENREAVPQRFFANSELYWKRTDNAVRGHLLSMAGGAPGGDRLYETQSLWDNSMGEACATALYRWPGHSVVHVNGGFHSAYWDGTVRQFRLRRPDAAVKTVAIVPEVSPLSEDWIGTPVADVVVFVESRAKNVNDGAHAVVVGREQRYRLHLPAGASEDAPCPLLIWLGEDGLAADESLSFWRTVVGEQAAIAVMEPPYRERQWDLSLGGRWFWSDRFDADLQALVAAVERCSEYLCDRYPIDAAHVVLAGEGSGATVAAAVALRSRRLATRVVAIEPRGYRQLKEIPLPLLEDWGDIAPPKRSLLVASRAGDAAWWEEELAQYEAVGLESTWREVPGDAWQRDDQYQSLVVEGLQIPAAPPPTKGDRLSVALERESPLARMWARRIAARWTRAGHPCGVLSSPTERGEAAAVDLTVHPEHWLQGVSLPRCPGPFGGTTVLVLSEGLDGEAASAFSALAARDPLAAASRFHRLRLAAAGRSEFERLSAVLQQLHAERRQNVLIVPAEFYAGAERMRALEAEAAEWSERMTLHWLPGLGGHDLFPGPENSER